MCFFNDYEYAPAVYEESDAVGAKADTCGECGLPIHPGEWRREVHAEQYEQCLTCDPDGDHRTGGDGECDHGDTFDYVCCERCHALRQAVRRVEEAEGCRGANAEPYLGGLYEQVDFSSGGWGEYGDKMLALGLVREYGLIPAPDPEDVFELMLMEFGGALNEDDDGQDYEFGGEG